jgi:DNA end-binding protein Ku
MAQRPSWKGFLRLSLVACPVQLFNAVSRRDDISFHLINPDTTNRIQMKPHDPDVGEVERSHLVHGFEIGKNKYVTLTKEDLDKVALPSSKAIEVERFVGADEIDPIYYDNPYYLVPDGKMAQEAYVVIRQAMRREEKVALGRLVLSNREHAVAIHARDPGMVLITLRPPREVRNPKALFTAVAHSKVDEAMVDIATRIIDQNVGPFEPEAFVDRYHDAVRKLIEARRKGLKPVSAPEPEPSNVVDLMEALKKSLRHEGGAGKRRSHGAPATKVAHFPRRGATAGKGGRRTRAG